MLKSANAVKPGKEENQVWCIITEIPLWGACFVDYYVKNRCKCWKKHTLASSVFLDFLSFWSTLNRKKINRIPDGLLLFSNIINFLLVSLLTVFFYISKI